MFIFVMNLKTRIMTTNTNTPEYFLENAEAARLEYVEAVDAAKKYAGTKALKTLKKDPEFIKLTNNILMTKKLWYDYNAAYLLQCKEDKKKSLLN